jgi:26S proteasome regulatory subunit N7
LGDVEVRDAILEKARLFEKIGDKDGAIEIYQLAYSKTIGIGKKMDNLFAVLLIYNKDKNLEKIQENIEKCEKLLEEGGDWERKNKLKVYQGIYNLMLREFKLTSKLFLDCISTFASHDIISYNELVYYTVLTSLISIPRQDIKKKIVQGPEILAAIRELPDLKDFLEAYYKCDYKQFFATFRKYIFF